MPLDNELLTMIQGLADAVSALILRIEALEQKAGVPATPDVFFERFWTLYPRKVARVDAFRAWSKLVNIDKTSALDAVAKYAQVWASAPTDRFQFIKYPASWLRSRSWEDGETEWRRIAGTSRATLAGAHTEIPGNHHPLDLQDAPPDIRDIARRWKAREDTTEEEDARYLAWEQTMRGSR